MHEPRLLEIALPVPLRRNFDYLPPIDVPAVALDSLQAGTLIRVPFGHQELIGVLLSVKSVSSYQPAKLRPALEIIDHHPVLDAELLELCRWAADYYQSPFGEALQTALPVLLRQGEPARLKGEPVFMLTAEGKGLPEGALKRARKQAELLAALQKAPHLTRTDLDLLEIPRAIAKNLIDKGLVKTEELAISIDNPIVQ